MTMRIPWHLHNSFLQHCVALEPLPEPEDIVIREVKKNAKALKGAISAKKAKDVAKRAKDVAKKRWANHVKARQEKY